MLWGLIVCHLPVARPLCIVVSESPVAEDDDVGVVGFPSSNGLVESVVNLPGPPGKPKYSV